MTRPIRFVKMSGAGNDFVVLDHATWESIPGDRAAWVRGVSRRGLSVGSDGVLVVGAGAPGRVRVVFMNPDGGEAFCGNGSRCAARYAHDRGTAPAAMTLETAAGEVPAAVVGNRVRLTLPPPEDLGERAIALGATILKGRLVRAGVPHLVAAVPNVGEFPLAAVAPGLRSHPSLGAEGANVNVVADDGPGRLRVRTWERGVESETLSCGTGAVAAAFVARLGGGGPIVEVVPASGIPLLVAFSGDPLRPDAVELTGDARFVYDGELLPEGIAEIP